MLTLTPPRNAGENNAPPHLIVNAIQASFFAVLPHGRDASYVPEWHVGNIYGYPKAPRQAVPLPQASVHEETTYDVLLSADYEVSTPARPWTFIDSW